MFDELMGLPAHPLLVHAAVVFLPLLVAAALAYTFVPFVRRWITWAAFGLAVVAPFAAWFATLSGNSFRNKLAGQGMVPEILAKIDEHRGFGDKALWASIGLAVGTALLILVNRIWATRTDTAKLIVTVVLSAGILFFAGATAYYAYKTGDSGARVVWGTG